MTKNVLYLIKIYSRLARMTIKKFKGRLRTDINRLAVTVATGDAAKTALTYGAVCQAVSYLLAVIGRGGGIRYKRKAVVG